MRLGLRHRPVLLAAAAMGLVSGAVAGAAGVPLPTAVLSGWCAGVLAHAVPSFMLMQRATPESIRRRAEALDEGEGAVLATTLIAAIASLGAVLWYLASGGGGAPSAGEVALALGTILLSWSFVHLLFAVRYAHEYWQAGGGLDFPGGEKPEWGDFLYFAFTIGMTFQTSDVTVSGRALRQLTLVHALVAFLFNMFVLAAAVNMAAGLVG